MKKATRERLESELQKQQEEILQLRAERDEYRKMLLDQVKHLFGDAKEWDSFNEKDYNLTVEDLLAAINSNSILTANVPGVCPW